MEIPQDWAEEMEKHDHDAIVHHHPHWHVTHNHNDRTGGFDHLFSGHEHEHDHMALQHSHLPHRNFEEEHQGEAHDHDHGEPVKKRSPAKKAAVKTDAAATPKTRAKKSS